MRIIPRIDVKNSYAVKGVQFEGLRKLGDPNDFGLQYYEQGADELIFMDIVASLYGRNSIYDLVSAATRDIFVPITVGGGIKNIGDVEVMLKHGADKVAVNTAAISNPPLITEIAKTFGSQAMVLSIEAKRIKEGKWVAYFDSGREKTEIDVVEWVHEGIDRGAGEIYVMSVDNEGRARGCDLQLASAVGEICTVPLIFGGGVGTKDHYKEILDLGLIDGVSLSHALHYKKTTIHEMKAYH